MTMSAGTEESDIYKDFGLRYSGDVDFLIRHSDINKIDSMITSLGYVQGRYDSKTNEILPINRASQIKWKLYMSNLYPYLKLTEHPVVPLLKIDFRYAFDDSLQVAPMDEVVSAYESAGTDIPEYSLLHLCTHFFYEAQHTVSMAKYKDFNIIKLCDIREYILTNMNSDSWTKFMKFTRKYSFEKAVFFTIFYLKLVYNDGYEDAVLKSINLTDIDFIDRYGENTRTCNTKYNKGLKERLFSCGNLDELDA